MVNAPNEVVTTRFLRELEEIALNFIRAFGLKYERQIENLSDPLLRWMDFRLRYIDPKPRRVVLSNKFPKKLPSNVGRALKKMATRISAGVDINPFQGAGLISHHDTSGKKRQFRTDLLWAEWGITHLHLDDKTTRDGPYFSGRADWLLFALVTRDECGLIDVRPHREPYIFSNRELIEVVAGSWPEWIEQYRLIGVLPGNDSYTAEETHQLRKNGLSTCTSVDGNVYMGPGMGVTSAATSLKVGMKSDRVFEYVTCLAQMVCDPEDQFQRFVSSRMALLKNEWVKRHAG